MQLKYGPLVKEEVSFYQEKVYKPAAQMSFLNLQCAQSRSWWKWLADQSKNRILNSGIKLFWIDKSSGVFSTGATGAIAPVILRKRLIAPVIFHLPRFWFSICSNKRPVIAFLIPSFEGKLLQKFLLRLRACLLYLAWKSFLAY